MEEMQENLEQMKQELEQLREENRRRVLLDAARAALESRGIDPAFAAFVMGSDDEQTGQRVEQFDRQLARTLQAQAARMAAAAPRDFAVTEPKKRMRGIRRV